MSDAADQRRAKRLARGFMVTYRCPALDVLEWGMAAVRDISEKGLRFIGEEHFPIGAILELRLQLQNAPHPLHMKGKVTWCQSGSARLFPEYGVSFIELKPADVRVIAEAVKVFLQPS